MARPKNEQRKSLTEAETLVMNVLWDLESATVHSVLETLNDVQSKDYAYTTVSTILRVLEKKGFVERQKQGRGHIYLPLMKKSEYQEQATQILVNSVFSGERTALIRNLLGDAKLTEEDLAEVKALLHSKSSMSRVKH